MSERLAGSFRDPSGFLFKQNGRLYRQINHKYEPIYKHLHDSGLYRILEEKGLLIATRPSGVEPYDPTLSAAVIEPELLPFISYPYEWSFSQLKDAALATLRIQRLALEYSMTLKDASAYNIQFSPQDGQPLLIDTLSFDLRREGQPWDAYRQFCQHFLGPLALMAHKDIRLNGLLRVHIDGIPLDLCSRLLPIRTRLNPGLVIHIHLHAAAQTRYAGRSTREPSQNRKMSDQGLLGLIDSLERTVQRLSWHPVGTEWADYTSDHNYSDAALDAKRSLVEAFLDEASPETVWDLGANTGEFSRLAAKKGIFTASFDIDPGAVERNYLRVKREKMGSLLPLLQDLTNPSSDLGWHSRERESLLQRGPAGMVLALALIHHLAISNNVPLAQTAEFFAALSDFLAIEFVPKSDSQVQRLLASREDIFPDYSREGFEQAFEKYFKILRAEKIEGSERTLYLMRNKN